MSPGRASGFARVALLGCLLLVCAACGRPSSRSTTPAGISSGEAASFFAGDEAKGPSRPGATAREPIPILVDHGEVLPGFARAAPPSAAHRRGTLVVAVARFDRPGSTHGRHDVTLLEVDLATAAHVRTIDSGTDWIGSFVADGATGPIAIMWKGPSLEVSWFDRSLAERAHHSVGDLVIDPDDIYACGREVVGDRVVLARADGTSRTSLWILDAGGNVVKRTCPGRWRPEASILGAGDDVVVGPIGADGGYLLCGLRADGTGPVRSRPYPSNVQLLGMAGNAYFSVGWSDDAGLLLPPGFYRIGADLSPVLPVVEDPRPPEALAAEERFHGEATRVNGTLVLARSPCCGNPGPYVFLYDPVQ
ncbi:MAG: hypothetical protein ACRENE_10535 [Polyangiaceae bacterium]